MDNAQDIIQAALDLLGTDVTVTLKRPGRPVTHVDGTLTGVGCGPYDILTLTVDGQHTRVDLNHVTLIERQS